MIYKNNSRTYRAKCDNSCPQFCYMECRYFLKDGGEDKCVYPDVWKETIASKIKFWKQTKDIFNAIGKLINVKRKLFETTKHYKIRIRKNLKSPEYYKKLWFNEMQGIKI